MWSAKLTALSDHSDRFRDLSSRPVGPFSSVNLALVPTVSVAQMREVDRLAIEEFGLDLLQMMENAGRAAAELVMEVFRPSSVTVLAGKGGNGGGGLAAARHLRNRGLQVAVLLSSLPGELAPAKRMARRSQTPPDGTLRRHRPAERSGGG